MNYIFKTEIRSQTREYNNDENHESNCDLSDDSDDYNQQEIIIEINEIIQNSKLIMEYNLDNCGIDKQKIILIHDKMKLIIENLTEKIKYIIEKKIELNITILEKLNNSKDNLSQLNKICNTIYKKHEKKTSS